MEKAWAAMEKAAAELANALGRHGDKLKRDGECAETDKMQKKNEDDAAQWLKKVPFLSTDDAKETEEFKKALEALKSAAEKFAEVKPE